MGIEPARDAVGEGTWRCQRQLSRKARVHLRHDGPRVGTAEAARRAGGADELIARATRLRRRAAWEATRQTRRRSGGGTGACTTGARTTGARTTGAGLREPSQSTPPSTNVALVNARERKVRRRLIERAKPRPLTRSGQRLAGVAPKSGARATPPPRALRLPRGRLAGCTSATGNP